LLLNGWDKRLKTTPFTKHQERATRPDRLTHRVEDHRRSSSERIDRRDGLSGGIVERRRPVVQRIDRRLWSSRHIVDRCRSLIQRIGLSDRASGRIIDRGVALSVGRDLGDRSPGRIVDRRGDLSATGGDRSGETAVAPDREKARAAAEGIDLDCHLPVVPALGPRSRGGSHRKDGDALTQARPAADAG
jgi:hypothetical protein